MRSGSAGSTSKSMISPRGVKCSVNVLPPSLEISIARQHGVERVHAVVAQDDLVQVGVAEPRDHRPGPAAVVRAHEAEERGSAPGVGMAGAEQLRPARPRDLEERPDVCGLALRVIVAPLIGVTVLPSWAIRKKPRLVVSRKSPGRGVDVERVHERRLLGEVHEPRRRLLRGRGRRRVAAAAGREQERERDAARARLMSPACASSHSASVVKPTMIPSIQYCERTASRG